MDTTVNSFPEGLKGAFHAESQHATSSDSVIPSDLSSTINIQSDTGTSQTKESIDSISGLLFKFPKLSYAMQSRGDGRDSSKLSFDKRTLITCSLLSICWAGLVSAYGFGLVVTLADYPIASFVYAALAMIILFPIALIWAGFFVYHYANQSHLANNMILEAARVLTSPALVASNDVKTLSSTVGHELNQLRGTMRDMEDRMQGISRNIDQEVKALNESSDKLHDTLQNISGTIRTERDAIIDLMKIVKKENQAAHNYLAEKSKTHIEVNETPIDPVDTDITTTETPKSTKEITTSDIIYQDDLRRQDTFKPLESEKITMSPKSDYSPIEPQAPTEPQKSNYSAKPEAIILRRERQLYEGVCALTVDLSRALHIDLPQNLWSRYMRGERHVFASHLFDKLTQDFATYQETLDTEAVRKLCNQFIARFETLRERLFDEPDIAVSEYLENSSVGKIYSILSIEYI